MSLAVRRMVFSLDARLTAKMGCLQFAFTQMTPQQAS